MNNKVFEVTKEFALAVIEYGEKLKRLNNIEFGVQLFKSGTSIIANLTAVQIAEKGSDFICKLKKVDEETRESRYWVTLCLNTENYPNPSARLLEVLLLSEKLLKQSLKPLVRG